MIRKLVLIVLLGTIFSSPFAQTSGNSTTTTDAKKYHFNSMYWLEANLIGNVKNKWGYQVDLQYRRQGEKDNINSPMFSHAYQYVFRPFITYQAMPGVKISLSPMGWWGTYSNNDVFFLPELRSTLQVAVGQSLGRVAITQRYRLEYSMFGDVDSVKTMNDPIGGVGYEHFGSDGHQRFRLRYMFRTIIPINNKKLEKGTVYANIYDELFVAFGNSVPSTKFFNQNRFFCGLGYKFAHDIRLEAGYLNQFQPQAKSNVDIDVNHVLNMFLIFDDFNSFFRKKEKPVIE